MTEPMPRDHALLPTPGPGARRAASGDLLAAVPGGHAAPSKPLTTGVGPLSPCPDRDATAAPLAVTVRRFRDANARATDPTQRRRGGRQVRSHRSGGIETIGTACERFRLARGSAGAA